jgi:hypothetical protein
MYRQMASHPSLVVWLVVVAEIPSLGESNQPVTTRNSPCRQDCVLWATPVDDLPNRW